jgi:hypothetical protein
VGRVRCVLFDAQASKNERRGGEEGGVERRKVVCSGEITQVMLRVSRVAKRTRDVTCVRNV